MKDEVKLLPAAPGFDLVDAVSDDNGDVSELSYTPVVAWAVSYEAPSCSALPIAIGVERTWADAVVRSPAGKFYSADGKEFPDEHSVLEEFKRRERDF